jgi:hypothetical protein
MKFELTNLHTGPGAHRVPRPRPSVQRRFKVRWPLVFCVAFSLAFWIVAFFGVSALMR